MVSHHPNILFQVVKRMIKNNKASIDMVQTGISLVVLLVILYVGVNMVGTVGDATTQIPGSYATGTLNTTDITADEETITIAGYTFEINVSGTGAHTPGNIEVAVADTTASAFCLAMKTAVNNNASLSAVLTATNTTSEVLLTYDTKTADGNSVITTEAMANATWSAATMTGGESASEFYDTQENLIGVTEDSYSMAGIMPVVMIAGAVLAALMGILYLFRRVD